MTATVTLTGNECRYLVLELPVDVLFGEAGGPALRLQFLRVRGDLDTCHEFTLEEDELWLMDHVLRPLLRNGKLPDGAPVEELAEKVWSALCDLHAVRTDDFLRSMNVVPLEVRKDG